MALPILRLIRAPEKFPFSREHLHGLPAGTLGKALVEMLDSKQLKLLPYYARHDIKHILLEYDTTEEGEVCLQCFMLGNGHLSFPVVATVFYGAVTMQEYWSRFRVAFRKGKNATPISGWAWFDILDQPVAKLISKINVPEHTACL
jgi:ubiquinone biosynthesis protein Coq4